MQVLKGRIMAFTTSLYDTHCALSAQMVEYAGYLMPIQYEGIQAEHKAVREAAGLFDVSHMALFELKGKDALPFLNYSLTNAFDTLAPGRVRYSIMCNDKGGAIDDLLVYCRNQEHYLIVVNAACRQKDFDQLKALSSGYELSLEDRSDGCAIIALQGPKSQEIIEGLITSELLPQKYYSFVELDFEGEKIIVSRTGYTGEFGYEFYLPAQLAPVLWNKLMDLGAKQGIKACGLGARDTLRLEAAMPLYGHELSLDINPLEAGLNFAVKMEKDDFVGKAALQEWLDLPDDKKRLRCGAVLVSKRILREGAELFADESLEKKIGFVCSGTKAPYLNKSVAMLYVDKPYAQIGKELYALQRSKVLKLELVELPFYKA